MNVDDLMQRASRTLGQPAFEATLILLVGLVLVRLFATLAQRRVGSGASAHWGLVARTAVTYIGTFLVLLAGARALGLDLTALVATAGVASVAIGFAAQTSLSNLIAGLFLLVDRPFQVGDTVEIEGRVGVVREISLLSTYLRTFDSVLVRWPNEVVLKSTILNYTRYPARRIDISVSLAYGSDLAAARNALLEAVHHLPRVLIEPEPEVITRRFFESAVELEVRAWVAQPDFLRGRTELVEAIHDAARAANLDLALPQLTLWKGHTPQEAPEAR